MIGSKCHIKGFGEHVLVLQHQLKERYSLYAAIKHTNTEMLTSSIMWVTWIVACENPPTKLFNAFFHLHPSPPFLSPYLLPVCPSVYLLYAPAFEVTIIIIIPWPICFQGNDLRANQMTRGNWIHVIWLACWCVCVSMMLCLCLTWRYCWWLCVILVLWVLRQGGHNSCSRQHDTGAL